MNTKVKVAIIIAVIGLLTVGAGFGTSYLIDKSSNSSTTTASKKADTKKVSEKKATKKTDKESDKKSEEKADEKEDVEKKDAETTASTTTPDTNTTTPATPATTTSGTTTDTGNTGNTSNNLGYTVQSVDEYGRPTMVDGVPIAYTADGRHYNPDTHRELPSGEICPKNYIEVGEPLPYPEWVDNGDSIDVCYADVNMINKAIDTLYARYEDDPTVTAIEQTIEDTGYMQSNPATSIVLNVYRAHVYIVR